MAKPTAHLICKKTVVYCTTSFVAFHRWKDAPTEHKYLGNSHRHVFKVKVSVVVDHDNRHIEFIDLKNYVDKQLETKYWVHRSQFSPVDESCEMMCDWIAGMMYSSGYMKIESVEVSEDGENGAIKYYCY